MSRRLLLAIGVLICESACWAKASSDSGAKPAGDTSTKPARDSGAAGAVAAMQSLFEPIAKMSPGPARTQRACADIDKLRTAAKAIPTAAPPSISVDPEMWRGDVAGLVSSTKYVDDTCKAPGQKLKGVSGKFRTAEQEVAGLQDSLVGVAEDLKPRVLPPTMKAFDQPLRRAAADKKRKHVCKDMAEMAKVVEALEAVPPGVDKAKWEEAYKTLTENFPDAKGFCDPKSDDNAVFDGVFDNVHQSFYSMVLLLPASKN
jgi:hypothetical protein